MNEVKQFKLNLNLLKSGVVILHALDNPARQDIIKTIHKHKEINVTDLYRNLKTEQSMVSAHLRLLREVGFVKTKRAAVKIYYSLNYERFEQIESLIEQMQP